MEPIKASFEIIRVQTMASGAIRYVLETSETELDTARQIMECYVRGALLETVMLPRDVTKSNDDFGIDAL